MKLKKSSKNLIHYLLIFFLTVISILVVFFNIGEGMDSNSQTQKYLADDSKENYIDLARAETESMLDMAELEFINDYKIDLDWDEKPNTFYIQIFDNGYEDPPSDHLLALAAVPDYATDVTVEFFASGCII